MINEACSGPVLSLKNQAQVRFAINFRNGSLNRFVLGQYFGHNSHTGSDLGDSKFCDQLMKWTIFLF
jgi:hypothetical protein